MPAQDIFTVIGTAVGALAVAAELRLAGHPVILTARPEDLGALRKLAARQRLRVENEDASWGPGLGLFEVEGIRFEEDLPGAVAEASVVIVMMPPNFHEEILAPAAARLRSDQVLLLCPGGLGGALLVSQLVAQSGGAGPLIAQVSSMPHAAHPAPEGIRVTGKKRAVPVGVFPALRSAELLARTAGVFPQFTASGNVIENGLASAGLGVHPLPMIMNAAQIEQRGAYHYDGYDITPAIARAIEAVDAERMQLLEALGARVFSFATSLVEAYGVEPGSFYEVVHRVGSYKHALSPPDIGYRYLSEDIPTQAVPAAALAGAFGIATPMLDAMIALAGAMHGVDYRQSGWSLERLGLAGLSGSEILEYVGSGEGPSHSDSRKGGNGVDE